MVLCCVCIFGTDCVQSLTSTERYEIINEHNILCIEQRTSDRQKEKKKRKKEEEMFAVTNTRKSQLKERTFKSRNERGCFIQFSSVVLSARFESVALLLLHIWFSLRLFCYSLFLYLLRASFSYSNELNCVTHIDSLSLSRAKSAVDWKIFFCSLI